MLYKIIISKTFMLLLASQLHAASFLEDTYNALGGDAATDDLTEATNVLSYLVDTSKTKQYRAVVKNNAGGAIWIGNSASKSYFMTVGHIVNSASSNTLTTHNGIEIPPVAGSVFHTQTNDFGLLEYNGVVDPALFGGEPPALMDNDLVANYLGHETALVGYGNLSLGARMLGRTRMLSYSNIVGVLDPKNGYRTASSIPAVYDPLKPYAAKATAGDSGGGVFLTLNGEYVLVGSMSAINSAGHYYTSIHVHKAFINSVVPPGVITWYSDIAGNPERSPEAVWSMDEASGTNVSDIANNGFDAIATNTTWVDGVSGQALNFNGSNSRVDLPASAFATIDNEITIAMWVYGDASQAKNDSVFYAVNGAGQKVLNIHLPWSNGQVYWDAGFSGTFDRIQKAATPNQYKGQWNHWVFVKNATAGKMEIYLNGSLFHSASGRTKGMSGITQAVLGAQISSRSYDGVIDEVCLYNDALSASEVSDLFNDYHYTLINGVPSSWLVSYGIAGTDAGALADTDGDGRLNWQEYHAGGNPLVNDNQAGIRVTEYHLTTGDYSGLQATVTLDQDLAENYFILVRGSRVGNGLSRPGNDYPRLITVPNGTGDMSPSGAADQIGLTRSVAQKDWEGVITVVECLNPSSTGGFKLVDILSTNLNGASGTDTSKAWSDIDQVTLFGGYRAGGAKFIGDPSTNRYHGTSLYTRLYPSGTNTLNWTRDAGGETLYNAIMTTFVVEWGNEWNVQHVNVAGAAGGQGANATSEYITEDIDPVNRANTWVWGTGTRFDAGIGDSAEASLITLGNGVTQNATESKVAVGSEYTDGSDFDVYVMTHPDLAVDHRFKVDGNKNANDVEVTVDNSAAGARFGWSYNGCNGTGSYFPRPRMWARYTADGKITISRGFAGQNFPAWVQGIDLSGLNN